MLMPGLPPRAALLWAKLDLYYQNGSRATSDQGVYLHHIQIHNLDAKRVRKAYCFGEWASMGRPTEIFLSAGASDYEPGFYFTDPAGKLNSGYLTGDEKERYLMNGEVVNYRNERIEVYPTVEIEYMPSIPKGCMESTIMLFSVTGCTAQNPTLELLPGPGVKAWNITSDPFPLPEEGLILNALGHIHDGGTRVESFLNGKPVCDSKAIYGNPATAVHDHLGDNQETVVSMTECSDIIPVKKGDAIKLVAHYDLNKHPARAMAGEHSHEMMSQMGVQTMYFAAKKPSSIVNWSPELGGDVASAPVVAPAAAGPVAPAPRPAADDDAEEDDDRRSRRE
ncbi:hypothetical protein EJ06DRAFT_357379 [Trichodelitschia bisporula]|uniref:Uncharacterized protein n=1 Tax=Trichodelitschia bisporula TaxID=703511 RepID=A0A6G1I0L5_9PEZI|nr:hypothetical protein EJ06DRAFT_357379 [Trichodelitschia bisporula]